MAELENKANALEKELARTLSGFENIFRPISWTEVRAALHPGEAAIEFVHFNYYTPEPTDTVLYAALLLKPGMPHPKFIPLCSEKDLLALLPAAGGLNADQANALYSSDDLHRLVWAPLEPELQGVRLAYCAPGGLLHRLNLGAIPTPDRRTVSDRFQVITLGSTRQLVFDPGAARPPLAASAIVYGGIRFDSDSTAVPQPTADSPTDAVRHRGAPDFSQIDSTLRGGQAWPYLKWSDKEADNIRAVLAEAGIATEVRKGAAATEESFKQIGQSGPSPRILHVSTHGYFFPDPRFNPQSVIRNPPSDDEPVFKLSEHPLIRSGLLLAGANQAWTTGAPPANREDGVLTAYEISQLDLRHTELVVLSACETGLGDIRGNEGVYGLQRAFKIAGARHVMMSLWQVPDYQTQELMTVFYRKMLAEQLPARQALRAAQEAMRAKRYEPYYWAGFVMVE